MPPRSTLLRQATPDVQAAGAVVHRSGKGSGKGAGSGAGKEVLLVHRPRYDDWSFPKGKLDRGEHAAVAAVREVEEETGLRVRLGPPLSPQRYPVNGGARLKTVHYWNARVVGDDDVSGYLVNDEIDEVAWLPWDRAVERLTYTHDRATLAESRPLRKKSSALVVLRHAKARSRKAWREDDRLRPLLAEGRRQAADLVPLLAAYDVSRVVTSSSTRCVQSVTPYAEASGWPCESFDGLSEEGASPKALRAIADDLLHARDAAVLCSHRPVLPEVFEALGVPAVTLEPGGMVVVHHRKKRVVATEVHQKP
ncbi:NUDIX domain-containing protein [Nocardioides sp. GCM10027113]|uniref:NUDIX hydrolase n=1 Tax=unclassified Nocardioides TaxID=2615069 RepID=UPI0036227BB3